MSKCDGGFNMKDMSGGSNVQDQGIETTSMHCCIQQSGTHMCHFALPSSMKSLGHLEEHGPTVLDLAKRETGDNHLPWALEDLLHVLVSWLWQLFSREKSMSSDQVLSWKEDVVPVMVALYKRVTLGYDNNMCPSFSIILKHCTETGWTALIRLSRRKWPQYQTTLKQQKLLLLYTSVNSHSCAQWRWGLVRRWLFHYPTTACKGRMNQQTRSLAIPILASFSNEIHDHWPRRLPNAWIAVEKSPNGSSCVIRCEYCTVPTDGQQARHDEVETVDGPVFDLCPKKDYRE
ncbi:hypothetical protein K432DRAFT_396230 [Lepidopterella palustris CBS 459.81]|uniref:Uncharacterized protein n=1 Tax=Lepidopterella palustris CBS 459.81 TaxID=1314670 RepID=A0A8E2E3E6_9PEZI|nr:hypothetical protein K432DRAFT_396230 [Lepidopterella palustris CBS 459.81]